jgi:hypothetical protein
MKQIIIIVLSLLFGYQQMYAQDSTKLLSFREKLLPQNTIYFAGADLTEKGLLGLAAVDRYIGLPANDKKAIMTNIAAAWREPLVLVRYGSKTELWGWNGVTGITELLDEWDQNLSYLAKMPDMPPRLPWFFYVGDQFAITSSMVNFSFNTRVGSFLLDNKWDCAATFSFGFIGYSGSDNTSNSWSFGIMGRRHFLIQNSTFSPNIGAQLMHTSSEGYSTNTLSLVLGISWFVGIGSIDFDLTIGSEVTGMGGYTIAPNMVKR